MEKSIYSLVLSDNVVDAVDRLARAAGISRSAMVNQILAERVAYTTPEMRIKEVFSSLQRSIGGEFYFMEQPAAGTLSCRSSLKYRYKPTVRYSVEIYSRGGIKAGQLKVSFRTHNDRLINDLTGFFETWAELERKYIADKLQHDIVYTMDSGRFTRTLNMPQNEISDEELGQAVAYYMAMFDEAMKVYFAQLPEIQRAKTAAEDSYAAAMLKQREII